jgi:hypothetical protein
MMRTTRQSDRAFQRRQLQRLAVAAGMTLSDGSPVAVGGSKCPPAAKIKAAIGFAANRMTRDQYSDARDDHGATRPYFGATHDGNDEVAAILGEWSGVSDCDGEMSLLDYLQISG